MTGDLIQKMIKWNQTNSGRKETLKIAKSSTVTNTLSNQPLLLPFAENLEGIDSTSSPDNHGDPTS